MLQIGKTQSLTLARLTSVGGYLTDGESDVLLPKKYVPVNAELGQSIQAFVYLDSEDRPVATTQRPKAEAESFAFLRCVGKTPVGAFLDLGLEKDLLAPFREQLSPMVEGHSYVVRIYLDPVSNRLVASGKLKKFLEKPALIKTGEQVRFLVADVRPRMVSGIVDQRFPGVVLEDELGRNVRVGQTIDAWVKSTSDDGLSLAMRPIGRKAEIEETDSLVLRLKREGGFLNLTDDSHPDQIRRVLGMSKGTFKRMIGHLYKQGKIDLEPYGIRLKEDGNG